MYVTLTQLNTEFLTLNSNKNALSKPRSEWKVIYLKDVAELDIPQNMFIFFRYQDKKPWENGWKVWHTYV